MSNSIREGQKAVRAVQDKIKNKFFNKSKIVVSMTETDLDKDVKAKDALKVGEEYKDIEHTGKGLCPIFYNSRKHSFSSTELNERIKDD